MRVIWKPDAQTENDGATQTPTFSIIRTNNQALQQLCVILRRLVEIHMIDLARLRVQTTTNHPFDLMMKYPEHVHRASRA